MRNIFSAGPGWGPDRPLACAAHPQHGRSRIFSSFAAALAAAIAILAATPAWSASCTDIGNLATTMSDNTVGGLPVQVAMPVVGLESGDTITFNTNLLAGGGIFEVIVTESPAAAQMDLLRP